MKKNGSVNAIPHVIVILLFFLLAVTYFAPAVFENKDIPQGDAINSKATGVDLKDYHKETGEFAYWSNTMFGGMPANYTYMPPTKNVFCHIYDIIPSFLSFMNSGLLFLYLTGFYILLLSLGCNPWLSLMGAIAYAFASYNIVIIEAGHINKGLVMATMAPIIGGIILCYRKKYMIGSLVVLIFLGLNVYWSHQQISYYLLLTIVILALVYLVFAIRSHTLPDYIKSSGILIVIAVLSIIPTSGSLMTTMDYTKESMRGGAVLQNTPQGEKESSGLDIDYAFAWSYGKGETMTLLIPNFYGASSHYDVGKESNLYKTLVSSGNGNIANQYCKAAPTYWGPQPFTSGPVYAGAIICFLFVLGLFIVKGPEKWWILLATILSILMSWGKYFPAFNEFLFHNLPLYSKFRAPSMSLVIANVTMVIMAVLALKEIIEKRGNSRELYKPIYISAGIVGGLCLIFALFGGSLCNFSATSDSNYPEWLVSAIHADRKDLLVGDSWRSLGYIAVTFLAILLFLKKKTKPLYLIAVIGVASLVDLWSVDKRFLNDDDFEPKSKAKEIEPNEANLKIMEDKDPDYRVLNLTVSTFNDATTSYFHKSVGGYSGAKLRRYQDIIDYHFGSKGITMNVVNMLNTRYFIVPSQDQSRRPMAQRNPSAMGNAWFVDSIMWVDSPDEEIEALYDFDPAKTAVVDKVWQPLLSCPDSMSRSLDHEEGNGTISLTDYVNPGYLIYESKNDKAQMAVFSEVFYKTWNAYIDGVKTPLVRVNYILRGLEVPAGNHNIEFKCVDEVYLKSAKYSLWGSILVVIVMAGLVVGLFCQNVLCKKDKNKMA